MSQNLKNQPSDNRENSARALNENQERKRYDGFEGMNYEQVRQPYNPQNTGRRNKEDINGGSAGTGSNEFNC